MIPRTDFETSIRSDAFALQSLNKFQEGKLIMHAWLTRGLTSITDLAAWRFNGDESKIGDLMERTPHCMKELLSLESVPLVGDEDAKQLVAKAQDTILPGAHRANWILLHTFH